ncbi:tripartite motif-containing protein 3-like [Magallana gigas]|uniref:tripartite motif-containing protein 3-like n=1 Tax=Magallana gigas TaxID=29159 RepID=UPI00333F5E70
MSTQEAESSPPSGLSLMDEPQVITEIDTYYGLLIGITCLNDTEVWTRGNGKIMRLYNLHGKQVKSIETKSGNDPGDITVTRNGDLVYADNKDRTVNIVKNKTIEMVIKLRKWKPDRVCSTSCGDLLVFMVSDDDKQAKVVRYSGSTEKQTIQYSDKRQPLLPSGDTNIKHICENRNQDVCVSDYDAGAVVVFDQAGEFRFRYTGPPPITKESACSDPYKRTFLPAGITTDSQSRILIVNYHDQFIHIIDTDGRFLRYIDNCKFCAPWGLCVDSKDNLFVAERGTRKLKKIRYCM